MTFSRFLILPATVLGLLSLNACDRAPQSEKEPSADSASETVYRVRGVVRKIMDDGAMAVIDHEEIPGYMAAMSMPFYPKEPSIFASLKAGQKIEFDYHVDDTRSWVEEVTILPEK